MDLDESSSDGYDSSEEDPEPEEAESEEDDDMRESEDHSGEEKSEDDSEEDDAKELLENEDQATFEEDVHMTDSEDDSESDEDEEVVTSASHENSAMGTASCSSKDMDLDDSSSAGYDSSDEDSEPKKVESQEDDSTKESEEESEEEEEEEEDKAEEWLENEDQANFKEDVQMSDSEDDSENESDADEDQDEDEDEDDVNPSISNRLFDTSESDDHRSNRIYHQSSVGPWYELLSTKRCKCWPKPVPGSLIISIDGACSNNGTENAAAASAVFFHPRNEHFNLSSLHSDLAQIGQQNGQRAEIQAAFAAVKIASQIQKETPPLFVSSSAQYSEADRSPQLRRVIMRTDCTTIVEAMTRDILLWKQNGFKRSDSKGGKGTSRCWTLIFSS